MDIPRPGNYRIDPSRSQITFRTRHLFGLGAVRGAFRLHEGEIRVANPAETSAVRATVDAGSFHTGNPDRDRTVRSGRLLDTERFPVFTFTSGRLAQADGHWILHGSLTVTGNEYPVDVAIERARTAGPEISVLASADLDRYAFGVTAMKGLAARRLSCRIEIVATRRNDDGHRG
jgi:polyisoprenoid-binding protein YceI